MFEDPRGAPVGECGAVQVHEDDGIVETDTVGTGPYRKSSGPVTENRSVEMPHDLSAVFAHPHGFVGVLKRIVQKLSVERRVDERIERDVSKKLVPDSMDQLLGVLRIQYSYWSHAITVVVGV